MTTVGADKADSRYLIQWAWCEGRKPISTVLHSSDESDELLQ